jgi:hypothetical protein
VGIGPPLVGARFELLMLLGLLYIELGELLLLLGLRLVYEEAPEFTLYPPGVEPKLLDGCEPGLKPAVLTPPAPGAPA